MSQLQPSYVQTLLDSDPDLSSPRQEQVIEGPETTQSPELQAFLQEEEKRFTPDGPDFSPLGLKVQALKGAGRAGLAVLESPIQARAAAAGLIRGMLQKATGFEFESSKEEQLAAVIHQGMKKVTTEGGPLSMPGDIEGRVFGWDDPRWWAGRGGESAAFLASLLIPGLAAAKGAQAINLGVKAVRLISVAASAAASSVLETGTSRADFRDQLVARGLSESEADLLSSYGASGYGIVAGMLDVIPLAQMLKRVPGGRKVIFQALASMASEAGTEVAQEELNIQTERLLDIDDPGSEGERRLAAGSLAMLAGGTVSVSTLSILSTDAKNEVTEGPVKESIDGLSDEQRAEAQRIIAEFSTADTMLASDMVERSKAFTAEAKKPPESLKLPVTFVGFQKGTENVPGFNMVNLSNGSTVKFNPAIHKVTGVDKASSATEVPPEILAQEGVTEDTEASIMEAATDKAIAIAQVAAMRRGLADMSIFTTPVRVAAEIADAGANIAVRDMTDRVSRMGGPVAEQVAKKARRSTDITKATIGQLSEPLREAMAATRGVTLAQQKASISLQSVQWVRDEQGKPKYGIARVVDAVEGRLADLTEGETKIVEAQRKLIDRTGRMFRDKGHRQFNYKTGKWEPFRYIPGGKVYPRLMHPNMIGIIDKGEGPIFNAVVDAIADANNVEKSSVKKLLQKMRADYKATGGPASFHRINAEFVRQLKKMPTHVRVQGDTIELVETHPFSYVRRIAENAAHRVGFIDQFGQAVGPNNQLAVMQKQIAEEGGSPKDFLALTRALNGLPVEPPLIEAGSPARKLARALKGLDSLARTGLLTMATIPNIPEPLGNIQALNGAGDLMRAVWNLTTHPTATISTLRQIGAMTDDFASLAFNPNRPYESIVRGLRETVNRATGRKFIEEFQEILAGAAALEKIDRMRAGKGNAGDIIDLMAMMKWSPKNAERIATGKGTEDEYLAVVRRAPAFMTAGAIRAAEKTRLSHNRLYRASIAFELYAQAKIRSLLNLSEAYAEATKQKDAKLFAAANLRMARYIAGTTAAGTVQYFLMSLVTGGVTGLKIAWEEMKDDPIEFFIESFAYAMFAGPYGSVIRVMAGGMGGGPWPERVLRATLPGFLLDESIKAISGAGHYRNMDAGERAGRFFQRLIPINRAGATVMAAFGFGQEKLAMDASVRAYWRWRFEEKPPSRTTFSEVDEDTQRFRTEMRKAYRAIKRFDDPTKHLSSALQAEGREFGDLRSSILRRRLLTGLKPEEQLALRDRIGEEAFKQVVMHDAILDGWAEALAPPKKRK